MLLAFYKVDNSLNYERHTFDLIDNPQEIIKMLYGLSDDELRVYDIEADLDAFEDDYNDEILDNGWWCVVIR